MSASGADSADTVDSSQTLKTAAGESGSVVFFIGSAFLSADAVLVSVVARGAITGLSVAVVVGVDRAGHTESVADEEIGRALLALT